MNVILEGPDGSGKSTLAKLLLEHLPLTLKGGEGPPKYEGEMEDRIEKYLSLDGILFDRHPCISQPIYGSFRPDNKPLSDELIGRFYNTQPLFIYCYGKAGDHVADHEGDTPDHLKLIDDNDEAIRKAYHTWACLTVPVTLWYTLEDPDHKATISHIVKICKEYIDAKTK